MEVIETRVCSLCHKSKPSSEFKVRKNGAVNRRCNHCARVHAEGMARYWNKNREKSRLATAKNNKRIRMLVLVAYGSACECCGEREPLFLSIEHKNGGGRKHREEIGGNQAIYHWLIQHNFPPEFGLLCFNCNCASGFRGGRCPHLDFDPMTMIGACA